ncbi:MAG: sugar phosphate isomerase/epimerase [Oscillospiraceae bacterium]|nr:sugar phosphate isomerase/epimerase [Oscillospiraceae bacterium]
MDLSTSINIFFGQGSVTAQMQRVYDAGFRTMDINFNDWMELRDENGWFSALPRWECWLSEIEKFVYLHGVRLNQSHGPLFDIFEESERTDHLREMCALSLESAARLGIPWVVMQPGTVPGDMALSFTRTRDFYAPLAALAKELGTGIVFENTPEEGSFGGRPEHLIALCDSLAGFPVGVCWDIGHAHIQGLDQRKAITMLGNRLRCLHIQDNDGRSDGHTAPYYGTVRWDEILTALKESGYQGDLTLEAQRFVQPVPESCKDAAMALLFAIGNELVKKY